MSLFVEVESVEKSCKVIINLDSVGEIAPLVDGGCALFMTHGSIMKVKDSYDQFKQFAMQTVSAEDIAKRFPPKKKSAELEIPKL
ncbi:hypothetical protein EBU71_00950 [bacterium]|nr:hypothetical protein [Candidatus Elulimicrobium humile]